MARLNICNLYARVSKPAQIKRKGDEYVYGMCYVEVVRGVRDAHDNLKYVKHDFPLIMSKEPSIVANMDDWKENDIVVIKGMVVSKKIPKNSFCDECTDEDGNPTKNTVQGNLLYINPIHVKKITSYGDDKKAAENDILENREISNQLYVMGTLCNDPKQFKTKRGLIVTQYQLAINRKFRIRTDDPSIKTDWVWVKTYGEQAVEDRMRLSQSSELTIDGFIQARTVHRKMKCCNCGKIYHWTDHAMEIVPYECEYVSGTYKSDDELERENEHKVEEIRQMLFNNTMKDTIEEEYQSEDVVEE